MKAGMPWGGRRSSPFLMGGHGVGSPAHRGSCLCSQESVHPLKHLFRASLDRRTVIISGSASSLPGGAVLQFAFKMENFSPGISTKISGACERHLAL